MQSRMIIKQDVSNIFTHKMRQTLWIIEIINQRLYLLLIMDLIIDYVTDVAP